MAAFLNTEFPGNIGGVMMSWPGQVLSVRLARVLHASDFTNWLGVLEDPEAFADLRGVGTGIKAEVAGLFSSIQVEFGYDQGVGRDI